MSKINKVYQLFPFSLFFLQNFGSLFRMMKAYLDGRYRVVPYKSIFKIVIAVVYIFFIIDFIPDFIPVAGWLDDLAAASWVLHSLGKDIQRFRDWETRE
jgi:uncharacterized membrane protein YkvA (DUF1232 family)